MEGAIVNGVITSAKEKMDAIELESMIDEITNKLPDSLDLIEVYPQTKKQKLDSVRKIKVCSEEGTKEMKIKIQSNMVIDGQLSFIG